MKERILIVDDSDTNLYLLKSMLGHEGFDIIEAKNGKEALEKAYADPPDAIVSDILMPVMDGYAFCRQCKSDERLKDVPFIFYTATYTEPQDEDFALSLGADRFVLKPQKPEILIRIVREVLEERAAAGAVAPKPFDEEMEFFRQHNEILFGKLEKKMLDLEKAHRGMKGLEEQYRLSFENVTDVVWTIDAGLVVRKMSPSVKKLLGYEPQVFIDRPFSEFKHILAAESMGRAVVEIKTILQGETIPVSIHTLIARDGSIRHCEISGSPIFRSGEIVGAVFVLRDITTRKRQEEELRKSEASFQDLFNEAPVGYFEYDTQGRISRVNRAYLEMLGYRSEEMIGQPVWNFIVDKNNRQQIMDKLAGVLAPFKGIERLYRRKDGTLLPVLIQDRLFQDEQGVIKGIRCTVQDIAERKQAEDALKESEARYRSVFENHAAVKLLIDPNNGNIIEANNAAAKYYGWPTEQFKRMKIQDFNTLPPEDVKKEIEKARTQKQVRFEFRHRLHDGSIRDVEVLSSRINVEGKDILHSIIHDITERKYAENKLQETLNHLKRAIGATIQVMVSAVESRDPYTAGHQIRVSKLACAIATEMGLPQEKIEGIRMASSIHDIGKLSIPAEILSRPKRLTDCEFSLIKEHPRKGYEILKDVESPWPLAEIVYQHHERMNGSGYPRNLKDDEILIDARITAVADTVEAMASHRPYRPALGIEVALEEIEKNKGTCYDSTVANACLKLFREKGYIIE